MKKLFFAKNSSTFPPIEPAKNFIPDWYRNGYNLPKKIKRMPIRMGFKQCTVFSDSLLTGYMIPLPIDIAVEQTDIGPVISWSADNIPLITRRDDIDVNATLPVPAGFHNTHFSWNMQYVFKIPKGYSALLTHPLNRTELPFYTLSGIVDGEFVMHQGLVPFFMSNTFEGIITAGTPVIQIILFKAESWSSKEDQNLLKIADETNQKSSNAAYGWYKKNIWKRKEYE